MSSSRQSLQVAFALAAEARQAVEAVLRLETAFDHHMASALAGRIADLGPADQDRARTLLATWRSPTADYVRARLALDDGQAGAALDHLDAVVAALPRPDPEVLLMRARLLAAGRPEDAIADLRAALAADLAYAFYARSEKLIRRLSATPAFRPRRRVKVALLGSVTLDLLATTLRATCFRDGIAVELQIGDFDGWRRDILDPDSPLHRFAPDVVVLILGHHDLALPPVGGVARMAEFCDQLRACWSTLLDRHPCHVVQLGLELPAVSPWGALEDQRPDGRGRLLMAANAALAEALPPGVSFVDPQRLCRRLGERFVDADGWHRARQYPAPDALPELARAITAQIRAVLGLSAKVLVTDLDNTLWGGVIGEDGIDGIVLGPPDPVGEAHRDLQAYLEALQERGILLAVCSKNNPDDALQPFRDHPEMVLRRDDFVLFVANWQDKSSNLRAMADDLGLGLDSFVFLDDNPVERAWIAHQLPEVTVVDHDGTPVGMLQALDQGRFFETIGLTDEDRARTRSYAARAEMRSMAAAGGGLDGFLAGLQMQARHGPVDPANLKRVAQLVNKTNQFNLTTRRYGEQQIAEMAASPEWWWHWFRLADRHGDHGLVGVMAARAAGACWKLDLWLMSCRVLGRRLEDFMAATLWQAALAAGARRIEAVYLPTARNGQVADLLPRFGFEPCAQSDADGQAFVCDLTRTAPPSTTVIVDASVPEPTGRERATTTAAAQHAR